MKYHHIDEPQSAYTAVCIVIKAGIMQHNNPHIAHLLEHMAAQERRKYDLCYDSFDATTYSNITCYRALCLHHNAQKTLEILYNIVHNGSLEERVFENEKRVMKQEYDGYSNTFGRRIDDITTIHNYKETLDDVMFDYIQSFYNDYYTDENIVVITSGGKKLDTSFMQYRSGKTAIHTPYAYHKDYVKNMDIYNSSRDYLEQSIAFIGHYETTREYSIERLIMYITTGYHSKSLYNILRYENGYSYFYDTYVRTAYTKSYHIVYFKTHNDDTQEALKQAIRYMDTALEVLTDSEIMALKDSYKEGIIIHTTPKKLVDDMYSMLDYGVDSAINASWESDMVDSITAQEIRFHSKKLFDRGNIRAEFELPMGMKMSDMAQ